MNAEGTWVQLDKETVNKYCFNWDGEAWSLAVDKLHFHYLQGDNPTDRGKKSYE